MSGSLETTLQSGKMPSPLTVSAPSFLFRALISRAGPTMREVPESQMALHEPLLHQLREVPPSWKSEASNSQ